MCISIQQITYVHPDKEVLFKDLDFALGKGDKLALIGDNGCGKSTLLQIIAGQLQPSSGTIVRPDGLYYIPQHFGQYDDRNIAEALQIDGKLRALHAILRGDTSTANFALLDDDWNIEEKARAALQAWDVGEMQLSQSMRTLSGGEKTRIFLAGIDIHSPSVVLMDEPTNHLDRQGREKLYAYIRKSRSTLMVVSHDRTLLNLLNATCELSRSEMTYYGGNYEFYKEQKALRQNALQQQLEEKVKALRLARKTAREAAERKEKQNVRSEKAAPSKGLSRMAINTLKDKAEKSTTRLNGVHQEKMEKLASEQSRLRTELSHTKTLKTDFNPSTLRTGKILVSAREANFAYGNNLLYITPLSFQIRSGERLLVEGNNGSGKTTLLKLITGELQPVSGNIERADFSYIYLNQEYSIIDNRLSVLQQAESFNRRCLPEHELKTILNRYLFPAAEWDKPCGKLSGGEKMRLTFCCLMISNNTPDLFVLDEPTNNLDIRSIEIITSTIRDYKGTVLVVSHDRYFVREIGIERMLLNGNIQKFY